MLVQNIWRNILIIKALLEISNEWSLVRESAMIIGKTTMKRNLGTIEIWRKPCWGSVHRKNSTLQFGNLTRITLPHLMEVLYGVPSPPKFNVAFYILLFEFYPTFVIWHRSLHFRHSTFLVQHSSFCFVHSPFRTQYSSSRSSSAGCTFKFSHSMLSICQSSFCFQHLTLRISLASLHCTFNFSNCTFHPLIIHQG